MTTTRRRPHPAGTNEDPGQEDVPRARKSETPSSPKRNGPVWTAAAADLVRAGDQRRGGYVYVFGRSGGGTSQRSLHR